MAKNTGNNRVPTKWIRDGVKTHYKRGTECEICGVYDDLEFHHYHSVALVLRNYARENGISIKTDDEVKAMRDDFYKAHWFEVVEDAVTLCAEHHKKLHSVYGKEPVLSTAPKQRGWVAKQRARVRGEAYSDPRSELENVTAGVGSGRFSDLIPTNINMSFSSLIGD